MLGRVSVKDEMTQLHPGFLYEFGSFNDRPINEAAVLKLQKSFRKEGPQSSKFPVIVMINPDDYEGWSYRKTENGIPPILTPKSGLDPKNERVRVKFIGGAHRMKAAQQEIEAITSELDSIDAGILMFTNGRKVSGTTLEVLIANRNSARVRLEALEYWDCDVYNEGRKLFGIMMFYDTDGLALQGF